MSLIFTRKSRPKDYGLWVDSVKRDRNILFSRPGEGGRGFKIPLDWRLTKVACSHGKARERAMCGKTCGSPFVQPREWDHLLT